MFILLAVESSRKMVGRSFGVVPIFTIAVVFSLLICLVLLKTVLKP